MYEISLNKNGKQYIKCLTCGLESYLDSDITYKYCSNCDIFHDEVIADEIDKMMSRIELKKLKKEPEKETWIQERKIR